MTNPARPSGSKRPRPSRWFARALVLVFAAWSVLATDPAHAASRRAIGGVSEFVGGEAALSRLGRDLDHVAAANQVDPQVLRRMLRSDPSLQVHRSGRLFWVEPPLPATDDDAALSRATSGPTQ
ncbi:hypothetical protein KGQ64_04100, partial [bacterium]|nr:hypothetical protein [bacterium]